jgi:opacity protein-like surface antigen
MILRLLIVTAVLSSPAAAFAQYGRDIRLGVQGSWADETDFGLGARVDLELDRVYSNLGATVSFDYFFPDDQQIAGANVDTKYWEINGNMTYLVFGDLGPYVGAGVNVAHGSVGVHLGEIEAHEKETDVGANLLAGLRLDDRFFAEARFEIGGGEQFVATAGLLF